jgi:hypothetical protein
LRGALFIFKDLAIVVEECLEIILSFVSCGREGERERREGQREGETLKY